VNGNTTNYTLDLNTGLTQVLTDGTNQYLYGVGRIAQVNTTTEYFLGDALGSVRQLTDATGEITLAKSYQPYGEMLSSVGSSVSPFAFTGEQQDVSGLTYLRARYYSSGDGRFTSKDTWMGDYNSPLSLNRWNYTNGNPINFTDPSGNSICYDPLPASCQIGLAYVNGFANKIKELVQSGAVQPVEGFATLADLSKTQFNGDIRDLVWAITIVLNDFDANRGMISKQIMYTGSAGSPYYIHQDWLPYRNNPEFDDLNWGGGEYGKWIHSLRGDWNQKYWDQTANQAYHFWGLLAISFFDGPVVGNIANWQHDGSYSKQESHDFNDPANENVAPPNHGISKPDYDLSLQAIRLGGRLRFEADARQFYGCDPTLVSGFGYTDIGNWIRSHLK
jgi:RHS repeat-associated protein